MVRFYTILDYGVESRPATSQTFSGMVALSRALFNVMGFHTR